MSTQNFNHTAAVGALLGGTIIGSKNAIADGRLGWENYPLRLWSWSRGFSQENIDHYYFAITLSDQKIVADFGPTLFDRLISNSMLAKSVDELIAAYHPALRRFIAVSTRTSLEYLLAKQDGLQYLLHTLSRAGTLHDVGNPEIKNLLPGLDSVIGEEVPPSRVALQTTSGAWAPEWAANLIDEKPIPVSRNGERRWHCDIIPGTQLRSGNCDKNATAYSIFGAVAYGRRDPWKR